MKHYKKGQLFICDYCNEKCFFVFLEKKRSTHDNTHLVVIPLAGDCCVDGHTTDEGLGKLNWMPGTRHFTEHYTFVGL